MDKPVLNARTRQMKGKGAAKKLRKNNQIPAVFYGPNREPIMLAMDYPELEGLIKRSGGENIILDLKVKSEDGTKTLNVILKDLQVDPIKDIYLHADFYEISMDKEITVNVPIHLINTPAGVEEEGGILQHVRRELTVSCLPDKLIEALEVDVSKLEIGDSVHIRDLALPEGITSLDEEHLTIAVVAPPTVVEEPGEEEVEEEVLEGEEVEAEAVEGEKVEKEKAETESEGSQEPSDKPGKKKGGEGKS